MRLLLVTQDCPPHTGGIQSYVANLAKRLPAYCEDFALIAPGTPSRRKQNGEESSSFDIYRLPIHSSWLALELWPFLGHIAHKRHSTHILYAQWFPAWNRLGLPRHVHRACLVHGRELLHHPLGRIGLSYARGTFQRLDAIIPNSQHTAALLPDGIDHNRVHIVYPGVDLKRFRPPCMQDCLALRQKFNLGDAPVITCLTRLVPRKGVDTLLRSFALLRERLPQARLLIGGDGPDLSRLQHLHANLNLGDSALFIGRLHSEELSPFLSLGVSTLLSRETRSDVEGFGMTIAEAQACGAPVVVAQSGGMPEALGDGAGILVPPDDLEATAQAFYELLTDPARCQKMSEIGRQFAASLDWESRTRAIIRILQEA